MIKQTVPKNHSDGLFCLFSVKNFRILLRPFVWQRRKRRFKKKITSTFTVGVTLAEWNSLPFLCRQKDFFVK